MHHTIHLIYCVILNINVQYNFPLNMDSILKYVLENPLYQNFLKYEERFVERSNSHYQTAIFMPFPTNKLFKSSPSIPNTIIYLFSKK